jgi:hypothetical protein
VAVQASEFCQNKFVKTIVIVQATVFVQPNEFVKTSVFAQASEFVKASVFLDKGSVFV